jgi:hypothetical protein
MAILLQIHHVLWSVFAPFVRRGSIGVAAASLTVLAGIVGTLPDVHKGDGYAAVLSDTLGPLMRGVVYSVASWMTADGHNTADTVASPAHIILCILEIGLIIASVLFLAAAVYATISVGIDLNRYVDSLVVPDGQ